MAGGGTRFLPFTAFDLGPGTGSPFESRVRYRMLVTESSASQLAH